MPIQNGPGCSIDDSLDREKVMLALGDIKGRDDVNIIIALGMPKEGFDWIWYEHALTGGLSRMVD